MDDDVGMKLIRSRRGLMAKLTRELGFASGTIPQWKRVPAELLPAVERFSDIPRHKLRPDICPPPPESAEGQPA